MHSERETVWGGNTLMLNMMSVVGSGMMGIAYTHFTL